MYKVLAFRACAERGAGEENLERDRVVSLMNG